MNFSTRPDGDDHAGWTPDDIGDPGRFIPEEHLREPGEMLYEKDVWTSGKAHEAGIDALEDVTVRGRALTAQQYAEMVAILAEAREHPEPWVGLDPTLDPAWEDPRGRPVAAVRRDRREMAERAAAADIAVRVHLSETTVRSRAAESVTLQRRCPRLWAAFVAGWVAEQNASIAARLAASLPDDDECWSEFDEGVATLARSMPPGGFRMRARIVRERVHAEGLEERHRRATADRGVWMVPELDGMATLTAVLPAAAAGAAFRRLDATARHLHDQAGEERTLAQLRADVMADLVATGETAMTGKPASRAAIAVTIPAMTLLGHGDDPAMLDGYGPMDLETARRLAGEAKSWVRVLTDPVSGAPLDIDRTAYRVPKALRRWLEVRDPQCVFPGCVRSARDCDIDHRLDWQYGGGTSEANLGPQCGNHHRIKHETEWKLYRDPVTGASWWTSPTALTVGTDPPPW